MNLRILAAAAASLMLASCTFFHAFHEARMHDARIEQFTRDYVAGRISYQRYHELCNVVNNGWRFVKADSASASSTSSDSSSDTTTSNNKDDKKHADCKLPPPPPGTVPPPPPPR